VTSREQRAAQARHAFGVRVREERERLGLTQRGLAQRADMNPTYISQIENGHRNTTLEVMVEIATALGVPLAHLVAD
jgi:transcriptional regulator with XRE-family HTH domain